MLGPRLVARRLLDSRLRRRLKPFTDRDWIASALIVAPHADDETLGCGGIACKKIAAGATTRFLFVTDGAASHRGRVPSEVLRKMREAEAREAVSRLGAPADHALFLGFPDGQAASHIDAIAAEIERLLSKFEPECLFIPHAKDFTSDHAAVNAAARKALLTYGRPTSVYEYPVWYWYHWPWVRLRRDQFGLWRTAARQTLRTLGGLTALSSLNRQAYVGDVLERKRTALAAHETQMRRPETDAGWATLTDLAGGDFIGRLLTEYEAFNCYEVNT